MMFSTPMRWRVSIVDGSSRVQNQKLRLEHIGRPHVPTQAVPDRSTMLSRRSMSMATQPMPPSLMAIFSVGYAVG